MARILIVEDDKEMGDLMIMLVEGMGHEVELATSGPTALELLGKFHHDVVFTDVHMEPMNGLQLVEHVKQLHPCAVIVFISGDLSPELQAQGMRRGALEFLHKPIRVEQLKHVLRRALNRSEREKVAARPEPDAGGAPVPTVPGRQNLASVELELETFYPGAPFAVLRNKLAQLALLNRYALIEAAPDMLSVDLWRVLHGSGPSANLPLVVRDVAAQPVTTADELLLPKNEGTLVLMNVEALPVEVQRELIAEMREARRMQIIATTACDPDQLTVDGRLVGTFYSRLALGSLRVGALSEREEELPEILAAAMRMTPFYPFRTAAVEIDPAAAEAVRAYAWPGNLAELWAIASRALTAMKEPRLTLSVLPDRIRGAKLPTLTASLRETEQACVARALRTLGTVERAAESLGVAAAELETFQAQPADSLFILKRDLSAPIPAAAQPIQRVLLVVGDNLVRETAAAALAGHDLEATIVSDLLAAIAAVVLAPRPFAAAVLVSPLTAFDPMEAGQELARLAPQMRLGLLGGRAPDGDPGPFKLVASSFRTGADVEAAFQTLIHGDIQRTAA
ncbi:response regulator [Opitutus sp. ER46]|uniref:sigma-54-dependent transcriptional regulator n=1 Tax=Opitutus sp. ER46 TaxID=2161864 RepID=UPI000D323E86|nr:response regulator [Opitutus sp. ER46]PTX90713.1 hypothetical protein DB354_18800 [Opitutus sp. ER46]